MTGMIVCITLSVWSILRTILVALTESASPAATKICSAPSRIARRAALECARGIAPGYHPSRLGHAIAMSRQPSRARRVQAHQELPVIVSEDVLDEGLVRRRELVRGNLHLQSMEITGRRSGDERHTPDAREFKIQDSRQC